MVSSFTSDTPVTSSSRRYSRLLRKQDKYTNSVFTLVNVEGRTHGINLNNCNCVCVLAADVTQVASILLVHVTNLSRNNSLSTPWDAAARARASPSTPTSPDPPLLLTSQLRARCHGDGVASITTTVFGKTPRSRKETSSAVFVNGASWQITATNPAQKLR